MSDDRNDNGTGTGAKAKAKNKAEPKAKPVKKPQLTPRQAEIRAHNLIRGIDNSVTKIKKEMENIKASQKELPKIVTGLSNQAAVGKTEKAQNKTAPKAQNKTTSKPAKAEVPVAKKTPVKKAASTKTAPKLAASTKIAPVKKEKTEKEVTVATASPNRPTFKEVAITLLQQHGPLERAKLRNLYIAQYGKISSQSTYGVYKNNSDIFQVNDAGIVSLVAQKALPVKQDLKDSDVDSFISKVEQDKSLSSMI